jgi:hypothetical protein
MHLNMLVVHAGTLLVKFNGSLLLLVTPGYEGVWSVEPTCNLSKFAGVQDSACWAGERDNGDKTRQRWTGP